MKNMNCSEVDVFERREFLKRSALIAAGAVLAEKFAKWSEIAASVAEEKSKVVVVTSDAVIREGQAANASVVEKMLERGICELAGKSNPVEAWKNFLKPTDVVGIADAGKHLENVPEVVAAVLKGIASAGVASMKLGYFDYGDRRAWLGEVSKGLKPAGISEDVFQGGIYKIPARFAVEPYTVVMQIPTVKPNIMSGVAGVIKHFATMAKRGPAVYHPDGMVTAGSVINDDFAGKHRLVIVDALKFAVTQRPHRPPDALHYQKSLILSTDAVAADAVALDLFLKAGCKPFGDVPPRWHIEAADKVYHAGVSDLARIEVRQVRV